MKKKITLEIIAANRDSLMQNTATALDNLSMLHRDFSDMKDEACILSLALNDSMASMTYRADYDHAIANSRQVLARFPNSPHRFFVARHIATIGRCQTMAGRYEEAKENLLQALEISETELEHSKEQIRLSADILHDLAMNNTLSQGNPKKTILYLGKALTLLSETDLEVRKGICLMGLGNVKYGEGRNSAALRYYQKAAKVFEDQYHSINLAAAYNNIGLCYTSSGQKDNAEKYLKQALDLRLRTGNNDDIANSYFNLAQFFDTLHDTEKTYENLLMCRDHSKESANKKIYVDTLLWLESISLTRNDPVNAMLYREERQKADQV